MPRPASISPSLSTLSLLPAGSRGKLRLQQKKLPALMLGAVGIVFGDIGTSPLYAVRQVFHDTPAFATHTDDILGVLSLVLWAIFLAVCVKYTIFVLRADHDGEGGTLAMLGLIQEADPPKPFAGPSALVLLVLFGSALLYGDGMITPSISVLSAVEGLNVATDIFKPYVLPIAACILLALFLVQYRGTGAVGALFGPVMMMWFVSIGAMGALSIVHHPGVLVCFSPTYGLRFLTGHGWSGYATLGAVVLAFSGVEALFADLGHFGRKPIILAWYFLVLPGLLLNYLGQGALLLRDPHAAAEPFYGVVPHWGIYPMVVLATLATVIASQALISGAFSLTHQAVNMGLAPRYAIRHTSAETSGQVYMPVVNAFLMIGCLAVVSGFQSSDALGNAYGLAVIGTMTITSIVFFVVTRKVWHWPLYASLPLLVCFLVFDLAFLGANLAKILQGAWVPLAIGIFVFTLLTMWTVGRARYRRALADWSMDREVFRQGMKTWGHRGAGAAVFLTENLDRVPLVGRHVWLRENCRYESVLLLKIYPISSPYMNDDERVTVQDLGNGLFTAEAKYGFMELPCSSDVLPKALPFDWDSAVFMLPQPIPSDRGSFGRRLLQRVFVFLARTGLSPIEWFQIPPHQAVSVGLELDMWAPPGK
jgi:KUP system potassium uptake protein